MLGTDPGGYPTQCFKHVAVVIDNLAMFVLNTNNSVQTNAIHLMIHSSLLPPLPRRSCYPSSALDRLKHLLRQTLRVTISDTRIFIGTFAGTDQTLNIILINTEEYLIGPEDRPDGRFVGQVVIPWRLVTKVEGETREDDKYKQLQAVSEMYC
jgi:small nuclear ribonucleoprotein (snRNP)-like protein